ncbi:MAG: hypothetical protein AAFR52_09600 [Pseudomonadota bacterium]
MKSTTNGRTVRLEDKPRWYQVFVRLFFTAIMVVPIAGIALMIVMVLFEMLSAGPPLPPG